MTEQREPGWYWVRANPAGAFFVSQFNGENFWLGMAGGREPSEIGERIPDNEELKALRAVAEAARKRIKFGHDQKCDLLSDRGKCDCGHNSLSYLLARLGERK